MSMFYETYIELQNFFELGGFVLFAIFFLALILWTLILERYLFLWVTYPKVSRETVAAWDARADKESWFAHRIRRARISQVRQRLYRSLSTIRTLIALCPFLGILGTVTGMIYVFDVMAITGTGNARGMAAGISRATLPTMAGLVAALSGLYFSSRLEQHASKQTQLLTDSLIIHEEPEV
ncbi:MAG: MotA/TolQ/ExbB proton channel family protein [Opitutales bacterium]